jgi:cell division protein FtsW (lipid II flippase)
MGGTSIWFTSLAIGIILSVSKDLDKRDREQVNQAIDVANA